MKHEKHVQKRKRTAGGAAEDSPRPTTSLPIPTILPTSAVVSTLTSNKQPIRPATSYHPSPQQYLIIQILCIVCNIAILYLSD